MGQCDDNHHRTGIQICIYYGVDRYSRRTFNDIDSHLLTASVDTVENIRHCKGNIINIIIIMLIIIIIMIIIIIIIIINIIIISNIIISIIINILVIINLFIINIIIIIIITHSLTHLFSELLNAPVSG